MKTVLFATDHRFPDQKALDYALVLCRRMAARLQVLHILQSPAPAMQTPDPKKIWNAAADPGQQWLPDDPGTRIHYRREITGEATGAMIERYVRNHHDIVLAVFDTRSDPAQDRSCGQKERMAGKTAMPRLDIPLVLMKKAK